MSEAGVGFGIVVVPEHPPADDMVARLHEAVEQARLAVSLGFDSLWAGQHYLSHPYAYVQPVPLLARLAAEAPGLTIGTSVILLGLQHPVRVAEEAATLDLLTGGRFVLGVGLGYRELEYDLLGQPRGSRVAAFEEAVGLLRRLWRDEPMRHDGPFYPIPAAQPTLWGARPGGPPIWMAANADGAVRRAARLAEAWIVNNHSTLPTLRRQMELYRRELRECGRAFPTKLPIIKELYVGATREEAFAEAGPFIAAKYESFRRWGQDRVIPEEAGFALPFDELAHDRFVIGDAETCAAEIVRHVDALGVNHFIFRVQWPGMPQSLVRRSLERFAESVAPAVRRAVQGSPE